MKSLQTILWEQDPGYFRLIHSFKTILAIVIATLIFYELPLMLKICANIAAGFSLQVIEGNSRKQQFYFLLLADLSYFISFMIASILHPDHLVSYGLLVVLAFFAMYLRRYGQYFSFAPIFTWVFAFLGFILPSGDWHQISYMALSLIVGFTVAMFVYFFVFPERKLKLFYSNTNTFFRDYAAALQLLLTTLLRETNIKSFKADTKTHKEHLHTLCEVNDNIARSASYLSTPYKTSLNTLYLKQYALLKVLGMAYEGFTAIIQQRIRLNSEIKSHLFSILATYAAAIANLQIQYKKPILNIQTSLAVLDKELITFSSILTKCFLKNKKQVLPLLNIHLSLRLIARNLKLLEHAHEPKLKN